jgi:hypothetical protein
MRLLQHLRIASPARRFAIVGPGVFVITFLTDLHKIAGTPALDLARGDEAVFNVSHFYVLDPLFFALSAGLYTLYARVCGRQTKPVARICPLLD